VATSRSERARATRPTDARKKPQQKITSKKPQKTIAKRAPARRREKKKGGGVPVLTGLLALGAGALFLVEPEKTEEKQEVTQATEKPGVTGRIRNFFSRSKKNDVDDGLVASTEKELSEAQLKVLNPEEGASPIMDEAEGSKPAEM
jgi:hypothetical protein